MTQFRHNDASNNSSTTSPLLDEREQYVAAMITVPELWGEFSRSILASTTVLPSSVDDNRHMQFRFVVGTAHLNSIGSLHGG